MNSFRTIALKSDHFVFKEKGSKFIAIAFPFEDHSDLKSIIFELKKQYSKAGHFCYAYKFGEERFVTKISDDGEPSNSAGNPILGQIHSFDLTNVLVVVVRYFGGTKLGIPGLISAYRTAAQIVLESCEIVLKTINIKLKIAFELNNINVVMRIIKENKLLIKSQNIDQFSQIIVLCPKNNLQHILDKCKELYEIAIEIIE